MQEKPKRNLDLHTACDTIAARLTKIRCSCGKRLGRGRGFFELPCNNKKFHGGNKVLVLGEAMEGKTKIMRIMPIPDESTPVRAISVQEVTV